ncbi:MAG: class II glutamine amidotransferase [Alphaproteobacteria bacterium]|nr:class II glutamine amidotransferase [Alphaproteobacteria bacterium]
MAYSGPPIFLDTVLFEAENSLVDQSLNARWSQVVTNGDGFGIGWYGERDKPGLYRDVLPAWNDDNLREVAEQVQSGLFFAHVRAATGESATARQNCHPFRHGEWMFMHNGAIADFSLLRRELDLAIPEGLYRHKKGTTDSETIFYLLLANGLAEDPSAAYAATVRLVEDAMAAQDIDGPFRFAAIATDGQRMVAIRYSSDRQSPSLFYGLGVGGVEQSVMIMSEPPDEDAGHWAEVPESSIVFADDGALHVESFGCA